MKNEKQVGVRVGLVAMILRDEKMLWGLRGNTETAPGQYAWPGGRMDFGESPEEGVLRELEEETGLEANLEDVHFVTFRNEYFPNEGKHYVSMVFLVDCAEGEPKRMEPDKCLGWEWIDPFDLPENTFWACRETIEEQKHLISMEVLGTRLDKRAEGTEAEENAGC